jgi:hypothetical protein
MLKIIYRISDHRDGATKIPRITKRQCFLNFVEVFGTQNLVIVADNTREETLDFIRSFAPSILETRLGNSKSFLYALDLALKEDDEQSVYLVEDDYLHLTGAPNYIMEGLVRADYVSLYDNLDKYITPSPNPLVKGGGENTKVILTASSHWKYTNSTTMTFAAKAKTLKTDQEIIRRYCNTPTPLDYSMFRSLAAQGRTLITPIPGRSTHCDQFPSPFIFDAPLPFKKTNPSRPFADPGRELSNQPLRQTL